MGFEISDKFADYEIVSVLGTGGMGRVYKVRNVLTNRFEAMKVLLPDSAGLADRGERFLREIRVHASLEHPNIAALRTALRVGDQVVMIMELVEGTTLQAIIDKGPLPLPTAVNYINQALSALSFAHQKGVIHRDIKPSNIMLTPDGTVKLMDFGIARMSVDQSLTSTGATLGSLYYMSPEQVKGVALDGRSDLYSLGLTLYQAVTGSFPYNATQDFAIMSAHLNEPPIPPRQKNPSIPQQLNQAILKSLAKNPADRYQTAADFRNALQDTLPFLGTVESTKTVVLPEPVRPPIDPRPSSTARLEMAYVLFMDIVAYSSLPMDRQTERISTLVNIVRGTEEFKDAHASDDLISLPTGDGMALVFFKNPAAPVECASEIARMLALHPEIKLRMGIHNGPVYRIPDINTNLNVAGGGINMAQRVMDCGDAGHILVSKTVADTLGQLSDWAGCFHDLGEAEVKHGVIVQLANFYKGDVGNPALPQKVRNTATVKRSGNVVPIDARVVARPVRRNTYVAAGSGGLIALVIFGAVFFTRGKETKTGGGTTPPPVNGGTPPPVPPVRPPDPPPNPPPSAGAPEAAPASGGAVEKSTIPVKSVDRGSSKAAVTGREAITKPAPPSPQPEPPPSAVINPPPPAPTPLPPASAPQAAAPVQQPGPTAEEKAAMQEQRERMITVASRATAARNGLQTLERQQARAGFSLRGDMVSARESMNSLLGEARASLAAGDVASAKRNLDLAEQQITKIERFLGQ